MAGSLDKANETKLEYKVVTDTAEDIGKPFLTNQGKNGWRLVQIINSRIGRANDRYYFERIIK